MNRKRIISIIFVVILLMGGGFLFFKKYTREPAAVELALDGGAAESPIEDAILPEEPPMEGYQWYANNDYGFAFQYPSDMHATMFGAEEGGNMVLVEGKGNNEFQIFITDFDEDIPVMTTERVHQDLPDLVIEDPQEAVLAGGLHALIFWSKDERIGRTREVWIVHDGALYQITAPAAFDPELAKIMKTWRFE